MRAARGIVAGVALWAGGVASGLPLGARAQAALDASLPLARLCAYGALGGARVVGGNAPIRCEPPAEAEPPSPRLLDVASNPVGVVPQEVAPVAGTERVWEDGRINPGRGVPRPVSGPAVLGARVLAGAVALP